MVFHAYPDDTDNLDVRKVIAKQIILHFYQYSEDFNFFCLLYTGTLNSNNPKSVVSVNCYYNFAFYKTCID